MSGVLGLHRGAYNASGLCAECGQPSGRAWFCGAHWHGQEWESARRCRADDGSPCGASRESFRRLQRRERLARGIRPHVPPAARAEAVEALRAGEAVAVVAAGLGMSLATVRKWAWRAGVSLRHPTPIRHGTTTGYTRGCHCPACRVANRERTRSYMARRNGRTLSVPCSECGAMLASEAGLKSHTTMVHGPRALSAEAMARAAAS